MYIVQTIPRNLAFLCARATEYPSTLELNNRYNRFSMDRAKDMLYSDSGLFNFVKIDADMKLRKIRGNWLRTEFPGYVFNISEHLWQADCSYKMTMARAQVFLLSLLGESGAVDDFDVACKAFLTCHYVRIIDDNKYECDCFAFKKWTECGHVLAAKHLDRVINILELLQLLHQPALPGRPRTIRPVGFAGGQPVQARTRAIEGGAVKYRGLLISHRFEGEEKVYEGMVGDNRTVPGYFLDDNGVGVHGQNGDGKDVVVWNVHFCQQYEEDDVEGLDEEMQLKELMAGKHLWKEMQRLDAESKKRPRMKDPDHE